MVLKRNEEDERVPLYFHYFLIFDEDVDDRCLVVCVREGRGGEQGRKEERDRGGAEEDNHTNSRRLRTKAAAQEISRRKSLADFKAQPARHDTEPPSPARSTKSRTSFLVSLTRLIVISPASVQVSLN